MSNNLSDDDLDDDAQGGPEYHWFQGPAPSVSVTWAAAAIIVIWTAFHHHQRVQRLRQKFGRADFRGSLLVSAYISAYVDNDDSTFSLARLFGKSTIFLALMQMKFQRGFLIMLALLVLESSLDTVRILLAYWNCHSLRQLRATSEDDAKELNEQTHQLEPTNVYEDLSRPKSIAVMVFVVQTLLIGFVMYDTYNTTTRTCFNGTDGCLMLTSMGSYCLYFMGTFMACVYYVGPLNSYGKKEHDPVFWLKLFVMSKQSRAAVLSWKDPTTEQTKTRPLKRNDVRIWIRFVMSLVVNSVCFHFLLNVLPVQIASKSSIMGVVFSSVGMIYLVDLDDTTGNTLTLVADEQQHRAGPESGGNGHDSLGTATTASSNDLEAVKQRLVDEAIQEIRSKLEVALAAGDCNVGSTKPSSSSSRKLESVTDALFLSIRANNEEGKNNQHKQVRNSEETPLMTA